MLLHKILSLPGATRFLYPLTRGSAVIFRMHRIRDRERGNRGRDPQRLRQVLEYLRRHGYEIVALDDFVRRLMGDGAPLDRTVAITMDDGYADQATVGAAIFAEFDCPVTTFVTTGFLDQELWFWWDKIEYIFRNTPRGGLRVELGGTELSYGWEGAASLGRAALDFTERCKKVSEVEKRAAVARLADEAKVEVPEKCPREYAPMSWDELRRCEEMGMRFAPHTVTHPILARTSNEQARQEILGSWIRLREEARNPVPVFAYPNGRPGDFGAREIRTLEDLKFLAAVSTTPGYITRQRLGNHSHARYRLPRFGHADSLVYVTRVVTGAERLRLMFSG